VRINKKRLGDGEKKCVGRKGKVNSGRPGAREGQKK